MNRISKLFISSIFVLNVFNISVAQVVMPDSAASPHRSQIKKDAISVKKTSADTIKKPDTMMRGSIYYRDSVNTNKSNSTASPKNKK